jgi:hypothetical protein
MYPLLETALDKETADPKKHGMPRHPDYYVRRTPVVGDGNGESTPAKVTRAAVSASSYSYKPEYPKSHSFNFLYDFYTGHEFNPRPFRGLDTKMFLYLWGATLLQLNIFAILAEHRKLNGGHLTTASITWAACLTWFAIEYMYHEHIHLYTYDIFAEKVGWFMWAKEHNHFATH